MAAAPPNQLRRAISMVHCTCLDEVPKDIFSSIVTFIISPPGNGFHELTSLAFCSKHIRELTLDNDLWDNLIWPTTFPDNAFRKYQVISHMDKRVFKQAPNASKALGFSRLLMFMTVPIKKSSIDIVKSKAKTEFLLEDKDFKYLSVHHHKAKSSYDPRTSKARLRITILNELDTRRILSRKYSYSFIVERAVYKWGGLCSAINF